MSIGIYYNLNYINTQGWPGHLENQKFSPYAIAQYGPAHCQGIRNNKSYNFILPTCHLLSVVISVPYNLVQQL